MADRPRPLPAENDEVVFGVSSVLLTRTAEFWASEEDAEAERVDLGGGRRGDVPAVEAWRQAVARDLGALGLRVRTGVFQEGRMGSVTSPRWLILSCGARWRRRWSRTVPGAQPNAISNGGCPCSSATEPALPDFVLRRHADALEAAKAKAQRGITALHELYPRRPVHPAPQSGDSDASA